MADDLSQTEPGANEKTVEPPKDKDAMIGVTPTVWSNTSSIEWDGVDLGDGGETYGLSAAWSERVLAMVAEVESAEAIGSTNEHFVSRH